MSVHQSDGGTIILEGGCPAEDAEPLLQLLQATSEARLDWAECGHLHTAVLQVILAARPLLIGPCGDPWVERWVSSKRL